MSQFEEPVNLTSIFEASLGALSGIIFPYILQPSVSIPPIAGILITVVMLSLIYLGLSRFRLNYTVLQHIIVGYGVTIFISVIFAFLFKVIDVSTLFSWKFFGSAPVAIALVGVGTALYFDWTDRFILLQNIPNGSVQITENPGRMQKIVDSCKAKFFKDEEINKCIRRSS